MNYSKFFKNTFHSMNLNVHVVPNTFVTPYNPELGWPLLLPDVDWNTVDLLLLHLQDFVTFDQQGIKELQKIQDHYKGKADKIVITHMHPGLSQVYSGPLNLIEFSSHNYREIHIMRERWADWRHIAEHAKTQAWQCLNGRKCSHRKWTVNILSSWPNGVISYGMDIPLPQWNITQLKGRENCDNFIGLGSVYSECAVNIVTETLYDPEPGLFSEKTLHALAAQQIPIVIGSRGLVTSLKQHGFDMFDDVVDISYDSEPNQTRLPQALQLNCNVIQGRVDLAPYQDRLRAQREFLLDDYTNLMELRFKRDCEILVNKLGLK